MRIATKFIVGCGCNNDRRLRKVVLREGPDVAKVIYVGTTAGIELRSCNLVRDDQAQNLGVVKLRGDSTCRFKGVRHAAELFTRSHLRIIIDLNAQVYWAAEDARVQWRDATKVDVE